MTHTCRALARPTLCVAFTVGGMDMNEVTVSLLPELMNSAHVEGRTAVVVDLLRASTTLVHAIEAGVTSVTPCLTPDDARAVRERHPKGAVLLGGERHGVLIEGFDLANSPSHYNPERIRAKILAFTTTNGTRAIHAAAAASAVLVGCFANVRALEEAMLRLRRSVHVVCAGTGGAITVEDCLFAGRVVKDLQHAGFAPRNDEAVLVRALYDSAERTPGGLLRVMRESVGGRNLIDLGLEADVEQCREENTCGAVPRFDRETGEIRRMEQGELVP